MTARDQDGLGHERSGKGRDPRMFLKKLAAGLRDDFRSPVPYLSWLAGGAVCAITGPYGTLAQNSFAERVLFWFGILAVASFGGPVFFRIMRILCEGRRYLFMGTIGTIVFTLLYSGIIYLVNAWWYPPGFPPSYGVLLMLVGGLTTLVTILVYRFDILPKRRLEEAQTPKPPLHLREMRTGNPFLSKLRIDAQTRLIRLTVRDHYVEAHTNDGMQMVHMPLADAVAALSALNGTQVHRSHWVNWDEVAALDREGGRVFARMSDGAEVPVSRNKAQELKDQGYV